MGRLRGLSKLPIHLRLPGSSMIEAIVASLIFLVVFAASLSTLTGLNLRGDEGYVLLEAERALEDCSMRYGDGTWADDTYTDTFAWGGITTVVSEYRDYDGIQQISMRATLAGSRKTIERTRLVVRKNE